MKKVLFFLSILLIVSCKSKNELEEKSLFSTYLSMDKSERLIEPYSYAEHLKKTRFKNGELDSLPNCAIILHDTQIEEYLKALEVKPAEVMKIQLGQVNPNYLYIVKSKKIGVNFIFNPGLAGAGGISTQVSILGALGVKNIVHIGTCGLFGTTVSDSTLIVSSGAYNDGGAMMIEEENSWPRKGLSYSSKMLSDLLLHSAIKNKIKAEKYFGVTVPIFFFQPVGFIKQAMNENNFDKNEIPYYIEMEGAPFFAVGKMMKINTASLVAGTDRYTLADNKIKHSFVAYDADRAKLNAVKVAISAFIKIELSK